MGSKNGFYALIQFSSVPERYEFINIGVVLIVPDRRFVDVKFSKGLKRIEWLFGKQQKSYLDTLKEGLKKRLEVEFSREWSLSHFEQFAQLRANDIRFSRMLPVVVDNPEKELEELFQTLVGEDDVASRGPKVVTKLRHEFDKAGVADYVEQPEPVEIPEYGITIEAPFAYKNGIYNLIDPIKLSGDSDLAMKEASKRAIEGRWLAEYSNTLSEPKRLVVVGDFSSQTSNKFVHAVSDMMTDHSVRFYRLDHIGELLEDIRKHPLRELLPILA